MEHIKSLMEKGWNIHIECKGKGRTYEMTYEASGMNNTGAYTRQIHAVGDSIAEVEAVLVKQVSDMDALHGYDNHKVAVHAGAYFPIEDKSQADYLLKIDVQSQLTRRLTQPNFSDIEYDSIEIRREDQEVFVCVYVICTVSKEIAISQEDAMDEAKRLVTAAIEGTNGLPMEVYNLKTEELQF